MTTATVTTAPTEAEIREVIEASAVHYSNHGKDKLTEAAQEYAADLRWLPGDLDLAETDPGRADGGVFWRDLRPSEDERLRQLLYEAEARAVASCHELIVSEYVVAMHAFTVEHPDAPRAERSVAA